jgi:inosine-uridine nucleoside N-ribohydrolase
MESDVMRGVVLPVIMSCAFGLAAVAADAGAAKDPVILDTDIGDDIDDTWALVMLLKSPELDLKLVTTTFGKAEYRSKLVAKLLTVAKRTDVAVGMGAGGRDGAGGQGEWVKDYDLKSYAGKVHEDGVQALIDEINKSTETITLISIGPSTTVAEALKRDPGIAAKAVFVGMQGSVRKGYNGGAVSPEWNVKANIPASQKVLLAPWKRAVITPLDTCGLVRLTGDQFKTVRDSQDVLAKILIENYRMWAKKKTIEELKESSVLFDTVAVYLAYPGIRELVTMEELMIGVTDKGITQIDPAGVKMHVATDWKDLPEYRSLLVKILTK